MLISTLVNPQNIRITDSTIRLMDSNSNTTPGSSKVQFPKQQTSRDKLQADGKGDGDIKQYVGMWSSWMSFRSDAGALHVGYGLIRTGICDEERQYQIMWAVKSAY